MEVTGYAPNQRKQLRHVLEREVPPREFRVLFPGHENANEFVVRECARWQRHLRRALHVLELRGLRRVRQSCPQPLRAPIAADGDGVLGGAVEPPLRKTGCPLFHKGAIEPRFRRVFFHQEPVCYQLSNGATDAGRREVSEVRDRLGRSPPLVEKIENIHGDRLGRYGLSRSVIVKAQPAALPVREQTPNSPPSRRFISHQSRHTRIERERRGFQLLKYCQVSSALRCALTFFRSRSSFFWVLMS